MSTQLEDIVRKSPLRQADRPCEALVLWLRNPRLLGEAGRPEQRRERRQGLFQPQFPSNHEPVRVRL
ncbi:MAG: hypothetical protein ACLVJK_02980 [Alistipes putredinis]